MEDDTPGSSQDPASRAPIAQRTTHHRRRVSQEGQNRRNNSTTTQSRSQARHGRGNRTMTEDQQVRLYYHSHLDGDGSSRPDGEQFRGSGQSRRRRRRGRGNATIRSGSSASISDVGTAQQGGQTLPELHAVTLNLDLPNLPILAANTPATPAGGRGRVNHEPAYVPAESLEQFAWLMLRGIEVRKVSRKAPFTKAPYKRYLYMNTQRSALLSSKVPHASVNNIRGIRAQRFYFSQIQAVEASDTHSRRIKIMCHSLVPLQFDVDTPRSRDILVRMLSKLVTHFSNTSFISNGSGSSVNRSSPSYSTLPTSTTTHASGARTLWGCDLSDGSLQGHSAPASEECCELPGVECAVCLSAIEDPVQLPCTHMYCRDCLASWRNAALAAQSRPSCPECRAKIPASFGKILSRRAVKESRTKKAFAEQSGPAFRPEQP